MPNFRFLGDVAKNIARIATPLTEESAVNMFNNSKKALSGFYQSQNYAQRLKQAGFSAGDSNLLKQKLQGLLGGVKFELHDGISAANSNASKIKGAQIAGASIRRMPFIENGVMKLKNGLVKLNKRINLGARNTSRTLDHELLHASSDNSAGLGSTILDVPLSSGRIVKIDKGTGIIDKAMEYNKKLMNENLPSFLRDRNEFATVYTNTLKRKGKTATPEQIEKAWQTAQYRTSPQEWRSRGLQLQLEAARNKMSLADYIKSNPMDNAQYADMCTYASPQQIYNYASKALGLSVPIGVGLAAYGLSNNQNNA